MLLQGIFEEYFTYPASGVQPPKEIDYSECDIYNMIYYEAFNLNLCWSPYKITQTCLLLWDVLGFPIDLACQPGPATYCNRTDVKMALHVPQDIDWELCSVDSVFHFLLRLIEANNRVLISNGDWDYLIITNGTLLAIQNMSWNGELGFQTRLTTPINIDMPDLQYAAVFDAQEGYGDFDGPQGLMGVQLYEHGLIRGNVPSGHRLPQDEGRMAYPHV
ncbi:unnamed protein product [Penicillium egyptiacum]|uniref:Uncharacterized protein n=1 Tax=Penicillium egyptiacum TaxID=1303716 RepID=A0A9W4P2K1_9EURO|nr:unnamed protein product [Penicillium egyptiacum]